MNEKSIFIDALDKTDPAERTAFLEKACAGDDSLRQRVEALLKSHVEAGSFLGKLAPERVAEELGNPPTELETQNDMNADEKEDLGFLNPSEKPESLGRLGHYEILEVVGRGGMGIVLRAFDEKLHRVVAIKVMAPALAATSPPRKRFLREARSAAQVRHEHVVDIHAVEEQPIPYLVMEYVSGETLQQKLDRVGPLEIPDVLRIGQQIARSLAAAHERGLIHRDIKPSNILLENSVEERVKITDFGLARAVADASLTQSGVIAGTPMYMAPEQTIGDTIDHRADLFSLGSVLYTMASGRPPFRATTSMATLKRVAEDTPRPIREIIPEVPEWLCDIISKLHAKKPEDRFQTAREVADLLGKCLTELQQGRVISVVQAPSMPEKAEPAKEAEPVPVTDQSAVSLSSGKRRWPIAAAILILLLGGFCLGEATGVTNVRSTVIRIFTPDGTLIVEADDSNVKVTIEGDGGLVITGAGVQEVRLPPGSYKVQAIKDGKPVALDRELVSITKGGREVVRVKFEAPPAPATPKVEKGAFVLLSGDGTPGVKFDTLAEAVRRSADGDTIEVRGNGPFITDPVTITGARLILRAGSGFRPIIRLSPQGAQTYNPILQSDRSLVVEGLEFQRFGQKDWIAANPIISMVRCSCPALHLANCRFRWDTKTYQMAVDASTATCVIRNCEFLGPMDSQAIGASDMRPVRLQRLENSVLLCDRAMGWVHFGSEFQHDVELTHNTLVSVRRPLNLTIVTAPSTQPGAGERSCRAHVSANLFDASSVLGFSEHSEWRKQHQPLNESEAAQLIPKLLTWREEQNSYSAGANSTSFWCHREPPSLKVLAGPDRLCGGSAKSVEGKIRYQGGDLRARLATELDKITPDDFRLRPDSAGYKAGKGGKDLGADVDLVGPGAAYDRWKKTPEYQQWRKDSGQIRSTSPKADGAFVVLGAKGVEVGKHTTLAQAVAGASDGDAIEVRGNGPFVSVPIKITKSALVVRAGAGFRPVIQFHRDGAEKVHTMVHSSGTLALEGLELRWSDQLFEWDTRLIQAIKLFAANCRFVGSRPNEPYYCLVAGSCEVRNCHFIYPAQVAIAAGGSSEKAPENVLVENCLHVGALAFNPARSKARLSRNTIVSAKQALHTGVARDDPFFKQDLPARLVEVDATQNVIEADYVWFIQKAADLQQDNTALLLKQAFAWTGRDNLYHARTKYAVWMDKATTTEFLLGPRDLVGWKKLWGTDESGSLEGRPRFQGGDLLDLVNSAPDKITAEDFRLRPDSPGFKAGKDGKDLGADVDLVGPGPAYERWKKTPEYQQWLKDSGQTRSAAPKTETGAFVVLGGPDVADKKFDSLAEAVAGASSGDTIEVRGNGPYVLDPIVIQTPLVIQAGAGYQPVFLGSEAADAEGKALLEVHKPLVLEGLQFRRRLDFPKGGVGIRSGNVPLYVANCRLLNVGTYNNPLIAAYSPKVQISNCEILGPPGLGISCVLPTNGDLQITNLVCSQIFNLSLQSNPIEKVSVRLDRNTLRTSAQPLRITMRKQDMIPQDGAIRLELTSNVLHGTLGTFMLDQFDDKEPFLRDDQPEKLIQRIVKWHEGRNLHQAQASFTFNRQPLSGLRGISTLDEWKKFWGLAAPDALVGEPKYAGGELLAKIEKDGQKVTPEDFRLRPDSPGFKGGKDGKDLGADIDLVGPGLAYERWKKTPEYQQWLKDTEHVRAKPGRKSEPGAFVLLGGMGAFEKKYDTLAAAVIGASAGDTIEVRGNGPYILDRITIKTPLVIRAGAGFQPHFIGSAAADAAGDPLIAVSAALVLEGLQFERRHVSPNYGWIITCGNAPLFVANCRLLNAEKSTASAVGIWHSPEVVVRNCEILRPDASAVSVGYSLPPKGRMHISNSVLGLPPNLVFGDFKADLSVILDHNTIQTTKLGATLRFSFFKKDAIPTKKHSIRMEVAGNVLDGAGTLLFNDIEGSLVKDETNQFFSNIVHWQERQNLHQARVSAMHNYKILPGFKASNLEEWHKFWGIASSDVLIGRPKFVGGDLQTKLSSGCEQVTPQDFRLRPDSPGFKAGKDGKDLGADVDLVGPGAAYERWKKTPAYQQWLKDSGQVK